MMKKKWDWTPPAVIAFPERRGGVRAGEDEAMADGPNGHPLELKVNSGRVLDNAVMLYCLADGGEVEVRSQGKVKESGPFGEVPTNPSAINRHFTHPGL